MALLRDTGQLVNPAALAPGGYGVPLGSERAAAAAATARISERGVPAWQQLQQQLRARLPQAQQQELAVIDDNLERLGQRMRTLARADAATGAAVR
jgi:PleD family two-component response regulator